MSKDDEQCLKLGRMVVTMIHDLRNAAKLDGSGYSRRKVTFPGGEVYLLMANDAEMCAALESGASAKFDEIVDRTPRSQTN